MKIEEILIESRGEKCHAFMHVMHSRSIFTVFSILDHDLLIHSNHMPLKSSIWIIQCLSYNLNNQIHSLDAHLIQQKRKYHNEALTFGNFGLNSIVPAIFNKSLSKYSSNINQICKVDQPCAKFTCKWVKMFYPLNERR